MKQPVYFNKKKSNKNRAAVRNFNKANNDFALYIDTLLSRDDLDFKEQDRKNLTLLSTHLMNVNKVMDESSN